MSAIAKPMIHSTKVIGGASDMINIENCSAITKSVAKPAVTGVNQSAKWMNTFHFNENGSGTPNFIVWTYDNETDRDADYTAIETLASNAL